MFSTLVPFAFFYAGLRRLPPAAAGIIATMEPVIAVLSAALFLGEGLRPLPRFPRSCDRGLIEAEICNSGQDTPSDFRDHVIAASLKQ